MSITDVEITVSFIKFKYIRSSIFELHFKSTFVHFWQISRQFSKQKKKTSIHTRNIWQSGGFSWKTYQSSAEMPVLANFEPNWHNESGTLWNQLYLHFGWKVPDWSHLLRLWPNLRPTLRYLMVKFELLRFW